MQVSSPNSDEPLPLVAPGPSLIGLTPQLFAGLPVVRLEFVLRAEQVGALPNFLGSTLRGAFGHALKRVACQAPGRGCEVCPLPLDCWYAWLFETQMPPHALHLSEQRDAPRPFVLLPPFGPQWDQGRGLKYGTTIPFAMHLFGAAVNGALYAAYAIAEMAERGLGVQRGRFTLQAIEALDVQGERISLGYDEATRLFDLTAIPSYPLSELIAARLAAVRPSERLKLRFLTRARLRVQDQLQDEIGFATLIRFLWRRVSLMLAVHGDGAPDLAKEALLQQADQVNTLAAALLKDEVWRHSNRQQRKLRQDGFLGEIVYEGAALPGFLPLLAAGEVLHVGSGATFGLGKYQIVV